MVKRPIEERPQQPQLEEQQEQDKLQQICQGGQVSPQAQRFQAFRRGPLLFILLLVLIGYLAYRLFFT
jgi:hypothetical protein